MWVTILLQHVKDQQCVSWSWVLNILLFCNMLTYYVFQWSAKATVMMLINSRETTLLTP